MELVHVPWDTDFFYTCKNGTLTFFGVFNYGPGTFSARLFLAKLLGIHGHFSNS